MHVINSLPSYLQLHPLKQDERVSEKQLEERKKLKVGESSCHIHTSCMFVCAYIKLHHEPLILCLHSLLHEGICQVLRVRRLLRLQRLLHLLLHLSPSCCFGFRLSLNPHLLQPSHMDTDKMSKSSSNRNFDVTFPQIYHFSLSSTVSNWTSYILVSDRWSVKRHLKAT